MALLVSVSTLVAAGAALVTVRQASGEQHLTRDGQVTDRYTAAVTNLGDGAEEVRIGGMYALQRIAQDSPRDATTVVQVLGDYVRSHAPLPRKGSKGPDRPALDVTAALSILTAPLADIPADLRGVDLHGADLSGADLVGADLRGADLRGADLTNARLAFASLDGANLSGVNLDGVELATVSLKDANLTDVDLRGKDLTGTILAGAFGYRYTAPSPRP